MNGAAGAEPSDRTVSGLDDLFGADDAAVSPPNTPSDAPEPGGSQKDGLQDLFGGQNENVPNMTVPTQATWPTGPDEHTDHLTEHLTVSFGAPPEQAVAAEWRTQQAAHSATQPHVSGASTPPPAETVDPSSADVGSPDPRSSAAPAPTTSDSPPPPPVRAEPAMTGGKGGKRPGRLAQARARIGEGDEADTFLRQSWFEQLEHTQRERERLWPDIVAILGVISAEPSVTQEVGGWRLTRDRERYRQQRSQLEELLQPVLHLHAVSVGNPRDVPAIYDAVYDELVGIGPLGAVWRDDEVTEILVDGWDRISVERDGTLQLTPLRFRDKEHAAQLARDLATSVSDRALNITNPLVTAELERARANFAYGPIVKTGLAISIRKFRPLLQMGRLLEFGALNDDMAEFLKQCVAARATLLVSGGTGTGKTTMLNALSEYIPDDERVVTIEDSFELNLSNKHVVSLQTKERASSDDVVKVTLADLLVNALRMRPDRIVVGEIREPHGARAMLQAATTGHDGTMTTIHANTTAMALSDRLSDLQREATGAPDEVCKRTVATAVNLVVQVLRKQGRRFISEIAVVDRSMVRDGYIVAEPVFVGDIAPDGTVTFRHVGGVRADTEIGHKLIDAGFDLRRWEPDAANSDS